MKKFEIKNFKAFGESTIAIDFTEQHRNLLLYGENGSGKSSIFEAIRLTFYRNDLLDQYLPKGVSKEERETEKQDFYNRFAHKTSASSSIPSIDVRINDSDFESFDTTAYHCYMLSFKSFLYPDYQVQDSQVKQIDKINLKRILKNLISPKIEIDAFCASNCSTLLGKVNQDLSDFFLEELQIDRENDAFDLVLIDDCHHLRESDGLSAIFNESRLHLVLLLILTNSILINETQHTAEHKILVLDDIVTSMDATNRSFILRYLFSKFNNFQILLLTHNIGFNNSAEMLIDQLNLKERWILYNLYVTSVGSKVYNYAELQTPEQIESAFNNSTLRPDTVGNVIRKRFEADLIQLTKIIHAGKVEESYNSIKRLVKPDESLYLYKSNRKILDGNDLVNEISDLIATTETPENDTINAIKNRIQDYHSNEDLSKIVNIIKELRIYEKLFLHSLSHTTAPVPHFNIKEVTACITLLKRLETNLKSLRDGLEM